MDFLYKKKNVIIIKGVSWLLFILYLLLTSRLLFFGTYRTISEPKDYNLIPFKTIWMYIEYFDHFNFTIWFSNLIGNILVFMPLGFLVPLLAGKMRKLSKVFILSLISTICVEVVQLIFRVGGFDVDDILLNTLGGVLGYIVFKFLYLIIHSIGPYSN